MSNSKGGPAGSRSVGGGGAATSAGILFEQQVGSLIGAWLLSGRPFDERLNLGSASPVWLRFETEAPIDDILVGTSEDGFVAIQAKTTVSLSSDLNSPFGKTVAQFVRHWFACRDGDGKRGWNRSLDPARDRLVLAVGPQASASIRITLPAALRIRAQAGGGLLTDEQQRAWDAFEACAVGAWASITSARLEPSLIDELAKFVTVFVVDPSGSDRGLMLANLAASLPEGSDAAIALNGLETVSAQMMAQRGGADLFSLRQSLMSKGVTLAAAPHYRRDIAALQDHSDKVSRSLAQHELIEATDGDPITIVRECQAAVRDAAIQGSLLVVGEPGAGKSGVLNALARDLRSEGKDVLELAVDRYSVETLEGLKDELRLEHGLLEVLDAWDGTEPGWLIIDALDATRGSKGEGVFRTLIEQVLSGQSRWRIVASIRTFDLRMGQQFRSLFKGVPPIAMLQETGFPTVRHIRVPPWSHTEFQRLLRRVPPLAAVLRNPPQKLRELAAVPFNTRLLSELIKDGVVTSNITQIASQVELLQVYWDHRVGRHGMAARLCIQRIVEAMVEARVSIPEQKGATPRRNSGPFGWCPRRALAGVLAM